MNKMLQLKNFHAVPFMKQKQRRKKREKKQNKEPKESKQ